LPVLLTARWVLYFCQRSYSCNLSPKNFFPPNFPSRFRLQWPVSFPRDLSPWFLFLLLFHWNPGGVAARLPWRQGYIASSFPLVPPGFYPYATFCPSHFSRKPRRFYHFIQMLMFWPSNWNGGAFFFPPCYRGSPFFFFNVGPGFHTLPLRPRTSETDFIFQWPSSPTGFSPLAYLWLTLPGAFNGAPVVFPRVPSPNTAGGIPLFLTPHPLASPTPLFLEVIFPLFMPPIGDYRLFTCLRRALSCVSSGFTSTGV